MEQEKEKYDDDDEEEDRVDCREVLATAGGFSPPPLLALPEYNTLHSLTTSQGVGGRVAIEEELGVKIVCYVKAQLNLKSYQNGNRTISNRY